jgi:hypothetical protein
MAAAWPRGQREMSGTWWTQEVGRAWQVIRVPVHRRCGCPVPPGEAFLSAASHLTFRRRDRPARGTSEGCHGVSCAIPAACQGCRHGSSPSYRLWPSLAGGSVSTLLRVIRLLGSSLWAAAPASRGQLWSHAACPAAPVVDPCRKWRRVRDALGGTRCPLRCTSRGSLRFGSPDRGLEAMLSTVFEGPPADSQITAGVREGSGTRRPTARILAARTRG